MNVGKSVNFPELAGSTEEFNGVRRPLNRVPFVMRCIRALTVSLSLLSQRLNSRQFVLRLV